MHAPPRRNSRAAAVIAPPLPHLNPPSTAPPAGIITLRLMHHSSIAFGDDSDGSGSGGAPTAFFKWGRERSSKEK